jgi:hypothetical protein
MSNNLIVVEGDGIGAYEVEPEAENMVNTGEATHRVVVVHGGRGFRAVGSDAESEAKVHIYLQLTKTFMFLTPLLRPRPHDMLLPIEVWRMKGVAVTFLSGIFIYLNT